MGKSNQYVFPWYAAHVERRHYDRVCVLGAAHHDDFTRSIDGGRFDFFDLTLDNWEINADWKIERGSYDLVVCTRCAYFATHAGLFVQRCMTLLKSRGKAVIDWGLGDHWRHSPYMIGWRDVATGTHETVTFDVNGLKHVSTLNSTFWTHAMSRHHEAVKFMNNVQLCEPKYVGRTLTDVVFEEVPSVLSDDDLLVRLDLTNVDMLALWPDAPQLYIITEFTKWSED